MNKINYIYDNPRYLFGITVKKNTNRVNFIVDMQNNGYNVHEKTKSNIEKDFPKQKITGADSFDDLGNLPVEQIRGIGPNSAKKLRSSPFHINSKYDFYVASQD